MKIQIEKALENLEKVILQADFEMQNIVRLNVYTTEHSELFKNFDVLQNWIFKHQIHRPQL
ncbi:RidA family protein [Sphingobacterium sp. UBA6320]|uniref:RidA family protein n=1 Tax=Sphingobacterium sp. UBA6320 TaxID=1947510 RepID=UPI0025EA7E95|nr:RidA family protein [Sphingobacterium sp. UBA6320]